MLGFFIQKPDLLPWEKWRRGWDTHPGRFRYYHLFSDIYENRMEIRDFCHLTCFNCLSCFVRLGLISALDRHPKTPRKVFTAYTRLAPPTDRHATVALRILN